MSNLLVNTEAQNVAGKYVSCCLSSLTHFQLFGLFTSRGNHRCTGYKTHMAIVDMDTELIIWNLYSDHIIVSGSLAVAMIASQIHCQ